MKCAFTLIELLVVITIIVVLLALLTPAIDKAVYQAQLAVCGTRLHSIGVGADTYAMDHKRWYPKHPAAGDFLPFMIKHASAWDFRSTLQDCIGLKTLVDPLAGKVDLATAAQPTNHQIFSCYVLWFGWSYPGESQGMKKMGDRVAYKGDRFNILASDTDMVDYGSLARASHPDHAGVMPLVVQQDDAAVNASEAGIQAGTMETATWWFSPGVWQRGTLDTNYLYGDGGVARFTDVTWDEAMNTDGRMEHIPSNPNNAAPQRGLHIPKH